MARRSQLVLGGGLAIAAALALGGALTGGPGTSKLGPLALDLDAQLRETHAAVQARNETLAQLPRLAWAVATDEQTVLDLTADELAFKPQPGESIEIGQVLKADGRVVPLLHLGEKDVVHLPLGEPGHHLVIAGNRLHVVVVSRVEPRTRSTELSGAVGLSRPVDLTALESKLADAGVAARISLGDASVTVGAVSATASPVPMQLSSDPRLKLIFEVPRHGRSSLILYLIALVIAALAVAGALFFYRKETAPADSPLPALVPEDRD